MNESISKKHEQFESELYRQPDEFIERLGTGNTEQKELGSNELKAARKNVELHSTSKDTIKIQEEGENAPTASHHINKQIKNETYMTTLVHTRSRLRPSERLFSKVVHKPIVESISEVGSKTVARPSGILLGAIFSLFGVLVINMVARYIGFTIPSSVFAVLFLIGFILGILVEALFKSLKKLLKN